MLDRTRRRDAGAMQLVDDGADAGELVDEHRVEERRDLFRGVQAPRALLASRPPSLGRKFARLESVAELPAGVLGRVPRGISANVEAGGPAEVGPNRVNPDEHATDVEADEL